MQQVSYSKQQEIINELNKDHFQQVKAFEAQIKNLTSQLRESRNQNLGAVTNFEEIET